MKKILTRLFRSPPTKRNSQTVSFFWANSWGLSGLIPWVFGQVFLGNANWLIILSFSLVILTTFPLAYWLAKGNFRAMPITTYFRVCLPLWLSMLLLSFGVVWLFY